MPGLPSSPRACALLAMLVLSLAGCEGRQLPAGDEGIDFGEGLGDGDGDGDGNGDGNGDGDGDGGEGEPGSDTEGSAACVPTVDSLLITEETPPESVACVERVLGDLTIGPTTTLINLEQLSSLREVGGAIHIVSNLALTSLAGLEQVERSTWLHIRRNPNLSALHGLAGLTAVEQITIARNAGMTTLAGLSDGLAPQQLQIISNALLASLDGLPRLFPPSAGQRLEIELLDNPKLIDLGGLSDCCADQALALTLDGNPALSDLGGLEGFTRLHSLRLFDNLGLLDLTGLDALVELGTLELEYNHCLPSSVPSFVNFSGAPALTAMHALRLRWVASLTSFTGLEAIVGLSSLEVRDNAALSAELVDAFVAAQPSGLSLDACGGVGLEPCPLEPCPMF